MTYATTDDVVTELGRPASSQAETDQWQAWLDRTERNIARRFTAAGLVLADQITLGTPALQDVVDVEVAAVIRKIDAKSLAGGLTSITTSIDDGTVTKRREQALDGDPLEPTFGEWAVLLPTAEVGAFSTRPGFEPDGTPADLLDWS